MEFCNCSCFVKRLLCVQYQFCNHLGEERAGYFALFVFLVFIVCYVALPDLAVSRVCQQFVIVLFPDHTHYCYSILFV